MASKKPYEGPTRQTIERLIDDLRITISNRRTVEDEEYHKLDLELDRMIETVRESAAYKRTRGRMEALKMVNTRNRERHKKQLEKVRRLYWSVGPTPDVLKLLDKLRKDIDGEL